MDGLFVRMRAVIAKTPLSRSALYKHIRSGDLDAIKIDGFAMIGIDSLARLLKLDRRVRPDTLPSILDALAAVAVRAPPQFDGKKWIEGWMKLGGIVERGQDVAITMPIGEAEDPAIVAAKAQHLRRGLSDIERVARIREAAGLLPARPRSPPR